MAYFEKAVKQIFPGAEIIRESREEKTVMCELHSWFSTVGLSFTAEMLDEMKRAFGTQTFYVFTHQGVDGLCLDIVLYNVHFPDRPE
jgi:hypothetical protein